MRGRDSFARILIFLVVVQIAFGIESIRIGDPVSYSVRLPVADSMQVLSPQDPSIRLLPLESFTRPNGSIVEFSVAIYDTGLFQIPPLLILLYEKGQISDTVSTEQREVFVGSVLADTASAPRPLKPYEEHPLRASDVIREFWPWTVAACAIAALVFAWFKYMRRTQQAQVVFEPPKLPPAEIAIRELIALRDKKYVDRGMLKEQFSEFSEIMRRYVEGRWAFPALEMTTYELSNELKRTELPACLQKELLPVLRESDLVKFAKQIPSLATANSIVELGLRIVDQTKAELEEEKKSEAA